jgi:bifunctional DNA-binding transcriptional regulator/antitoxin component of YhaV-PrlF toxin-antitoxin module
VTLDRHVEFKVVMQRGSRLQVPKLIRWEFKLEPAQVLRIALHFDGHWGTREEFFGHINKAGRITVPKLICSLLKNTYNGHELAEATFVVELEPADKPDE